MGQKHHWVGKHPAGEWAGLLTWEDENGVLGAEPLAEVMT